MALSIERYLLIKHNKVSTNFSFYIIPILIVTITYKIPGFFELRYMEHENGFEYLSATEMRKSYEYVLYYLNLVNLVINAIIPMSTVIILNTILAFVLIEKQKHWRQMSGINRRDHRLSLVLIILALVYVVCHSFRFGLNIYELITIIQVSF